MQKYIPKMYKKNIFDINYEKLKNNGIKCILFDLDNTLLAVNSNTIDKKICSFVKKLKKVKIAKDKPIIFLKLKNPLLQSIFRVVNCA